MNEDGQGRVPTTEVLTELISAESFQEFYAENVDTLQLPSLSQYLAGLCEDRGILPHRLFHETDIEKSLGHQIFSGRRRLSRDNALKMAFGLELDVKETQRLLTISKNSQLYPFIPRDAALLYCLHHGTGYQQTQGHLFEWGMTVLGDDTRYEKHSD